MACLDMYNSEHKMGHHHHHHHHHQYYNHNHLMASPRISFSNDFVDAQQAMRQEIMRSSSRSSSEAVPAVSSDFEFSVTNYSMMSADELFFKGRLLPFKDSSVVSSRKHANTTSSSSSKKPVTTLRDELLNGDDGVTSRPTAKGSSWKSLLGLKRAHGGGSSSKKPDKSDGRTITMHGQDDADVSKTSQDLLNEDVEIGI